MAAKGYVDSVKNVYNDPMKWQLVKSWAMFAFGVYLAREFALLDSVSSA